MDRTYFNQLQKEYDSLPAICLESREVNDKTVDCFIKNFLTEYNRKNRTIEVESKRVVTGAYRSRSIRDIYLLSKHYFPEVTLADVAQILADLLGNDIFCLHCKDVGQIVFFRAVDSYSESYLNSDYYENGYLTRGYNYDFDFYLPECDTKFLEIIDVDDNYTED